MDHQLSFADSEFNNKRRQTRKEKFLGRMEKLIPWQRLESVIAPYYPKAGNGRRPYPLSTMLRIHCMQQCLLDATIIEAPSSTKNKTGERDPEMHQTKKGNQWHFGMKAHIGVDARTGLTHSFTTTAANEHDLNQAEHLLHSKEEFIFADSGYRGAENRKELEDVKADWHVAEIPSKVKELKKHPRINKVLLKTEYLKASIRAKVEHPFRVIKCQFGFTKARYRGLMKNDSKLAILFALANIARVDQMLRA
ncbi:MAG: IS5 family transposase [Neptuniibacter sp.]